MFKLICSSEFIFQQSVPALTGIKKEIKLKFRHNFVMLVLENKYSGARCATYKERKILFFFVKKKLLKCLKLILREQLKERESWV